MPIAGGMHPVLRFLNSASSVFDLPFATVVLLHGS